MARTTRPTSEHRTTAREAGLRRVSLLSILAGTATAYGTFAIAAAVAGAIMTAADAEADFRTNDWTSSGFVGGLVTAVVLLIAYLFGGYVAGRMARRSGLLHGIAVVVLSIVMAAIAGGIASMGNDEAIEDNLRSIGLPTSWDQVENVAVFGAIASLAAIVLGGILGGMIGERWHTRLSRRVADPERGPAADARVVAERERERAEHLERERNERLGADPVLGSEAVVPGPPRPDADVRDRPRADDERPVASEPVHPGAAPAAPPAQDRPTEAPGPTHTGATPEPGRPGTAASDRPHYTGPTRR